MQHLASKIQVLDYQVLAIAGRFSGMPDDSSVKIPRTSIVFAYSKQLKKYVYVWNMSVTTYVK